MGGAAVSWPRGPGFDSHLTVIYSHASKPMEHGLSGDPIRGSSSEVRAKYQCDAVRSRMIYYDT